MRANQKTLDQDDHRTQSVLSDSRTRNQTTITRDISHKISKIGLVPSPSIMDLPSDTNSIE